MGHFPSRFLYSCTSPFGEMLVNHTVFNSFTNTGSYLANALSLVTGKAAYANLLHIKPLSNNTHRFH